MRTHIALLLLAIALVLPASASGQTLAFIDENGQETTSYLEGSTVYLRLTDATANTDPATVESVVADISTTIAGDLETLTLNETSSNSGVFEGSIPIIHDTGAPQSGVLETRTDSGPPFTRDTLDADYAAGAATASASMVGSFTRILDVYARPTIEIPALDRAYLQIVDPELDDPYSIDSAQVTVTALGSGDSETLTLDETGLGTGTFEGSIDIGSGPLTDDGTLDATAGETIEARHQHISSPDDSSSQATITGSQTTLVDAAGSPVEEILEASTAYLSVIDHGANSNPNVPDITSSQVTSLLGADSESLSLTETGDDTGVFSGSLPLTGGSGIPGNGWLETDQLEGPPHQFDTVTATHTDASGQSSDSAPTLGGRIWFIDEFGAEVSEYPVGGTIFARAEDHEASGYIAANVTTASGDFELLFLNQITIGSQIHEGWIAMVDDGAAIGYDGVIQAQVGEEIQISFFENFGYTTPTDHATVGQARLDFLDENGTPTQELLEGGEARLRLFAAAENLDPGVAETVTISLGTFSADDTESLVLTETDADTNIFEGSIQLVTASPGISGNGFLETGSGGPPEYAPETVSAGYGNGIASATARTVGARIFFIDAFGQDTTTVPAGDVAYVRVLDNNLNDPQAIDTVPIGIMALGSGDTDSITATETGFDTGIFEGFINLGPSSSPSDGLLDTVAGEIVEAMHAVLAGIITDQAQVAGSQTFFIDATGQLADIYLFGDLARVRVIDHDANSNPSSAEITSATLTSELTADAETISLTETGPDTGIFEGSIITGAGIPQAGNGILETQLNTGPPERLDTLTATHGDAFSASSDTVQTQSSRLTFIDGFGNDTVAYATGDRVWVRVEDLLANNPAQIDVLTASLSSDIGDFEDLFLQETGKDTGIFEGWMDLEDTSSALSYSGLLEAQAGTSIFASYSDPRYYFASDYATITAGAIEMIDAAGEPTDELIEAEIARVRVTSHADNADPQTVETVGVTLSSFYGADSESLTLTETGPDTGVFEGQIPMTYVLVSYEPSTPGNGLLETSNSDHPAFSPDQVTATFGSLSDTAVIVGQSLAFIDAFGQETETYAQGDRVYVRVEVYFGNDPGSIDVTHVNVSALTGGDTEFVILNETGFDTNRFEGFVQLGPGTNPSDGLLDAALGEQIEARHFVMTGTSPAGTDLATIAGSATFFIDNAGAVTTEILQGTPAIVRVIDHDANSNPSIAETTSAQLSSEVTGDAESISLVETGPDTGVFEGQILTRLGSAVPGDGFLQTDQDPNPPELPDVLTATHVDAYSQSSATATTIGSRLAFVDAAGNDVSTYATGGRIYLRLEDQNANIPSQFDVQTVRVSSSLGDTEDVYMQETGNDTGIFLGYMELEDSSSPFSYDSWLQALAGSDLIAGYNEVGGGFNADYATVTATSVEFFDEAGLPTSELLENTVARIRVVSVADNSDPGTPETISISVTSFYAADSESLVLSETAADSGIFEGQIDLQFIDPPTQSGTPGNGIVETENSYLPEQLPERVTASYGGSDATATTLGLRLFLVDEFGQDVEVYAQGDRIYVRLETHTFNDPGAIDVADVTVTALGSGDVEQILANETGYDTAVFEGSLQLGAGSTSYDGLLNATAGEEIEALRNAYSGTGPPAIDRATIGGSSTFFIDEEGGVVTEILQGTAAIVRVIDHGANSNPSVAEVTSAQLSSEVTGDSESLSLVETGPDTGVFEGQMLTRLGSAVPGDGFLQTDEPTGPPERPDILTATHVDGFGQSSATAATLGSRLRLVDAAGNDTDSYATGGTVYVLLEDQNFNIPSQVDFPMVQVFSSLGDSEDIYLSETGKDTGLFEGLIGLQDSTSGNPYDGLLQAVAGMQINVNYNEVGGGFASDYASITATQVEFFDQAGLPTSELLENTVARIRVVSVADNLDPGTPESISISVDSLYAADSESLVLNETAADSGIFEGEIDLFFIDPPTQSGTPGNGTLETENSYIPEQLGERVTASYGGSSATATTFGLRLFLVDEFGWDTEIYAENDRIYVRLESHTFNDPGAVDVADVTITALGSGDVEQILANETGPDTAIFEGSLPLGFGTSSYDGTLWASAGEQIEALRYPYTGTGQPGFDVATIGGSQTFFLDAFGQPALAYFQGSVAYVGVIDHGANQDPGVAEVTSVQLTTEITGDAESLTLNETGADTGIFTGSIELRIGNATPGDGFLTTDVSQGPPLEFDTLTATHVDGYSQSQATISTRGSRIVFIDSLGAEVATVDSGLTNFLRVIDHGANIPTQVDNIMARVDAPSGDYIDVYLTETGADTGIFEGSFDLDENPVPDPFDSLLQAQVGDRISATYSEAVSSWVAWNFADVITPASLPPAVTITTPVDGASFVGADLIAFAGSANDPEDGDLSASLGWTSNTDGPIGTGASFSTQLSLGTHYITAQAIDSSGRAGQMTVMIEVNNTPPVPVITAPADGATFDTDDVIAISGTASDYEDGDVTASLTWFSDLDGNLGTDDVIFASLSEGNHLITAMATDSGGLSGYASINLTIEPGNTEPTVSITAPASGATFFSADSISFTGTASDLEDGDISADLIWSSDLDGVIGTGGSFSANLSIGSHIIFAGVTDSGGLQEDATILLTINNTPPVVSLVAPIDGATYNQGDAVTFNATASDYEDGDITVNLTWESDIDGFFGPSGGSFPYSFLSVGTHVITTWVDDSGSVRGSDSILLRINAGPNVSITAPADFSAFNAGDNVTFTGTADDFEDGDLTASIAWTSDLDGALGTGGSVSTTALSSGTHVITASITDADGFPETDAITITVNAAPTVSITAPADGAGFNVGDSVSFAGSANDAEDGDLTAGIAWASDLDGAIGTGGSFSTAALSAGTHVITASVTDAGGLQGSDAITITVNAAPTVSITAPADGAGFNVGDSVSFAGSANDAEDGDLTAGIAWTSDLDGAIGTGGSFNTAALSAGTHVITASVTDAGGLQGLDAITITINAAPTATITAPADGSIFQATDTIGFAGSASDPEDGDLTATLAWTSNLDGAIGTGGSFSASLSVGVHTITASITDAGGLQDTDAITVTVENTAPSVTISAPADGAGFNVGDSVSFAGSASDFEDGDLTAGISWSSSLDGAIGSGGSFATSGLSAGTHVITASVTDAGGLQDSDTITITVNAAPTATITAPADGSTFQATDSIAFAGSASDPEDSDLTTVLAWTSNLDGAIGTGGSFSASLSVGVHTITASVIDAGGLQDSDAITVTVENTAPSVNIAAPTDGAGFNVGDSVSFAGSASDFEDGDLTAGISWSSSLDGNLGSGGSFSTSGLSAGTHVITASVTDGGGLQDSDAITITVNAAPAATITAPADGSSFTQGDSISFIGTASDPEQGDLSANLAWSSDLDGALGSGASFSTSGLSVGTHTITALVIDAGGLSGSDAITVTVQLPPVQVIFTSIADEDGWVRESSENSNVGGARNTTGAGKSALRPGDHKNDRQYIAIVSFDTSSIPDGATIVSATLRMRRGKVTGTNPFTTHGSCRVDVQTGGFSGSTALQNSDFEAAATAAQSGTLSNPPADGDWSEASLDAAGMSAIHLTGTTQMRISFDLDDNDDRGNDYMGYYSANNSNSSNHPQLVVVYQP